MSPVFSLDSVCPAVNRSGDRPAVLCVMANTASSGTLQQRSYMSAANSLSALQYWEKHFFFCLLQKLLTEVKNLVLNIYVQKSVAKVTNAEGLFFLCIPNNFFFFLCRFNEICMHISNLKIFAKWYREQFIWT